MKSTTQSKVVFHCLAHVIDDNNGGVGRGQGIENVSKGSEIRGRRRWLMRRDDKPYGMVTTAEALAEEDEP